MQDINTLEVILGEIAKLRSELDAQIEKPPFLNKTEAARLLSVHKDTLDKWKAEYLIEGIHYTTTPGGDARYFRLMLEDWFINRTNPAAHQRAIAAWNQQRLANQKSGRPRNRR